ncbi:MAG: hypothetical protein ACFFDN_05265 [Candidatus Hodarchaeota archaeon]
MFGKIMKQKIYIIADKITDTEYRIQDTIYTTVNAMFKNYKKNQVVFKIKTFSLDPESVSDQEYDTYGIEVND